MAVDLNNLVDSLKSEVNPPGTDFYPNATDEQWALKLSDAFWELRLKGVLGSWEENVAARGGPAGFSEQVVTPLNALVGYDGLSGYNVDTDMPRDLQQLVVLWAGWKTSLTQFQNLSTMTKSVAGPVSFEVQKSAQVLKNLIDAMHEDIKLIIRNLSVYGVSSAFALDAIIEREWSTVNGQTWWIR